MSKYFEGFEQMQIDVGGVTINVLKGGTGAPMLMLHGHPETHLMWHKVAPKLAEEYTLILPDLRGYGESSHPKGLSDHSNYSKRTMAADQVKVMQALGYDEFYLVGHDRGARVSHRMLLDYPGRVKKCVILDILPTYDMYMSTNKRFATSHYHWFFLIQPPELPERLLSGDPAYFFRSQFGEFSDPQESARIFPDDIKNEYIRLLSTPEGLHSICEDYRAGATIDLEHDAADRDKIIQTPIMVLWGQEGNVGKQFEPLSAWRERASNVTGFGIPNCAHFIPEDAPEATWNAIREFMR